MLTAVLSRAVLPRLSMHCVPGNALSSSYSGCAVVVPNVDEEAVCNAARRLDDPEARRRYVEQACGDDRGLQARVEALLRVHDEERSFLEPPTHGFLAGAKDPLRE